MKFLSIYLKGYIGLYTGLGVHEVNIDLSKANSVVEITGPNGSGKSTIINTLHLNPDPSSAFIDGYPAEKRLVLLDRDIVYRITIKHDISKNGTRKTPTISFRRCAPYGEEELNPTGLVSFYTEKYMDEFDMDPNYFTLSMISSSDRGLADRTPAQRKKYIASACGSVETFNSINKLLTKRSQVLKSNINALTAKIMTIGDTEMLNNVFTGLCKQRNTLDTEKANLIKQIGHTEAQLNILDPNGDIRSQYDSIASQVKDINGIISALEAQLKKHKECSANASHIDSKQFISNMENMIANERNAIDNGESNIEELLKQTEDSNTILLKQSKIESFSMDEYDSLIAAIDSYEREIHAINDSLMEVIDYQIPLTKDELLDAYGTLMTIRDAIADIRGSHDSVVVCTDPHTLFRAYERDLQLSTRLKSEIDSLKSQINKLYSTQTDEPPKDCTNSECPFLVKSNNIRNLIEGMTSDRNSKKLIYEETLKRMEATAAQYEFSKAIIPVLDMIEKHKYQFMRIPLVGYLLDTQILFKRIEDGYLFNDFMVMTDYIRNIDTFIYLHEIEDKVADLKKDAKVYEERVRIIEEIQSDINKLNEELNNTVAYIETTRATIKTANTLIASLSSALETEKEIVSIENTLEEAKQKKEGLRAEFKKIEDNISSIQKYAEELNRLAFRVAQVQDELNPVEEEMEKVKYSMTLLHSYTDELNEIKEEYKVIEILKKHSSSTSGIQTIYMDMYMRPTLSLANKLLGNLFRGELELLPYVINENEFRIPFTHSGFPVDDVSSGSTSQICMIGMVIGFALMMQGSNHYNIICLDEIDGGLDYDNRIEFISLLEKLMRILGIEQVFIISHNTEAIGSNVTTINTKDLVL